MYIMTNIWNITYRNKTQKKIRLKTVKILFIVANLCISGGMNFVHYFTNSSLHFLLNHCKEIWEKLFICPPRSVDLMDNIYRNLKVI